MVRQKKILSNEELEQFKNEMIKYDSFKELEREQQSELFKHYLKNFKQTEIAEMWNVKETTVYAIKAKLKKEGFIKDSINQPKTAEIKSKAKPTNKEVEHIPIFPFAHPGEPDQIRKEPIQVIEKMDSAESRISLDEFMKMLEIQQRIADKMEEAAKARAAHGIQFNFKGDFDAPDLTKKLNKILLMLDGENGRYKINIEIQEVEGSSADPLEENAATADPGNALKNEVDVLQGEIKKLKEQVEQQKEIEKYIEQGYKTTKKEKDGLHAPKSEYKNAPQSGIVLRNGKKYYQTFYICLDCNHKAKHYVELGSIYVNCNSCGKRMRVKQAVENEHLKQDIFGNYFIAGKYKRQQDYEKEKNLFEAFNA